MTTTDSTTADSASTDAAADPAAGELRLVDPRELLVDRSIRQAQLTREFVADVAERGVRVPIVARVTGDGGLRVRLGHRRTLAAVEAGLGIVPVLVEPDVEQDDIAGEVGRIVDQFAENEHRAALTVAERVGVVEQLTAFGVAPAQIAKRLRVLKRPQADAALQVAGSDAAMAAAVAYDLTLEQAAGLAEFDADAEVTEVLLSAAADGPGRFAHVLQQARDDRAEQHRRQEAGQVIAAAGITVLDGNAPSYSACGAERPLRDLADGDGQALTAADHADCPGHAAHVGERYGHWTAQQAATVRLDDTDDGQRWPDTSDDDDESADEGEGVAWRGRYVAVYVCTDHAAYGHHPRWTRNSTAAEELPDSEADADARKEAAREQRRVTIDNNKAWRSAEQVRRAFLGVFLGRKTPPKGSAAWVAGQLAHGHHDYARAAGEGHPLACQLFGVEPTPGLLHRHPRRAARPARRGQRRPRPGDHPRVRPRRERGGDRRALLAQPDQLHRCLPAVPRRPRLHPHRRGAPRVQ